LKNFAWFAASHTIGENDFIPRVGPDMGSITHPSDPRAPGHNVYPDLLRKLSQTNPNRVWVTSNICIAYRRAQHG
jgi:hypothetical protein